MSLLGSYSTGKIKQQNSQLMRITQSCPRPVQNSSHKKDYERPQPIRIAHLIAQSEDVKRIKKESAHKKILPERVGLLLNKEYTASKDPRKISSLQDKASQLPNPVRRHLHFNDVNVVKNNKQETSKPTIRQSLLLPPNSIKDKHLSNFNKRKTERFSKYPKAPPQIRINEENEESETNTLLLSNEPSTKNNSPKCKLTYTKSKTNEKEIYSNLKNANASTAQSIKNSANEPLKDETHAELHETSSEDENNITYKECVLPEFADNCVENLCDNLQNTKIAKQEKNTNVEPISSEMIQINKTELINLKDKLEGLVTETEKNLSNLKSALIFIEKLLPSTEREVSSINPKTEEGKHKLMLDMREQPDLNPPNFQAPMLVVTSSENLSTTNLENKTAIKSINNKNLNALNQTSQECTPRIKNYRKKRSIMEYMALKSTMNFLETPDGKKLKNFSTKRHMKKKGSILSDISNKVLTDLQSLYSDSPETS